MNHFHGLSEITCMFYEIENEVMGGGGVEIKFCFSDLKMQ